ncbi:DUF1761 domain-containing protein [Demequina sp. NBRC 110057]|uniref:DUF1761 domain-containing protein n=1 Tax=Demequina sp. NBRC 110057 TaxID=1570346 RepID=UPI000A007822|nr:DUF1761 domain-containing protein [Demequina sp. NBRC 110057]
MEWLSFDGVPWWGVLVAFLVTFVFGWFYYSPAGLFPLWSRLGRIEQKDVENAPMAVAFGGTIAANVLGVILLAVLMVGLGIDDWGAGLAFGAVVGLVFRGGAHALHNGFAARHPGVTALDALHDTVALGLSGLVLALFM